MIDNSPKIIYEPSQFDAIRMLVDKRVADGTLHPEVLDQRLRDFALSIKSTDIATKIQDIPASGRISSEQMMDIVDRLFIDISTLYKSLDRAENAVNFKMTKSEQQYKASFDSYLKVKSDVSSFVDGYKHPEFDEIRKITLFDKRNESKTESPATVDGKSNKLTLHGAHTNIASRTRLSASVDFEGEAYTSEGALTNIVDPDPNTYWQAVVMMDTEVDVLTATVDISMSSVQSFSSIFILPFSPQPLRVADIQYSVDGTTWSSISGFSQSLATQNTDYVSFNFAAVVGRFVRITLEQHNSIFRDRLVPVSYEEITQEVFKDRLTHSLSLVDFSDYESRSEIIKEDLINTVIQTATLANGPADKIVGYEYIFGLSDVSIFDSAYDFVSEFSSLKFANYKNAFSVELQVTELQNEATSVEYDIDIGRSRRLPIVPIAAQNFVRNELLEFGGRAFKAFTRFDIDLYSGVSVFENGVALDPLNYSFDDNSITLLSTANEFIPSNSNIYTASYSTVSGSKVEIHNLLNSIVMDPETFTQTSPTGELTLKSCPHIEYGVINDLKNFYYNLGNYIYAGDRNTILGYNIDDPDETITIQASSTDSASNVKYLDGIAYGNTSDTVKIYSPMEVLVNGIPAVNITNYLGGPQQALSRDPFGKTAYEFIHTKNTITFGTRIVGKSIEVRYNSMAEHLQLVTTLRRTSSLDDSVTPVVKDATLYIKSRNK